MLYCLALENALYINVNKSYIAIISVDVSSVDFYSFDVC